MALQLVVNPKQTPLTGVDTKATFQTNMANAVNNDILFTSKLPGVRGNQIKVVFVDPGGTTATLGVVVTDGGKNQIKTITVNLGRAASAINTTANALRAAIAADPKANALVTAANAAANDGTGLVSALALTALTGGALDDVPAESVMVLNISAAQAITLCDAGALVADDALTYTERRAAARILRYNSKLTEGGFRTAVII